ncbi:hypothetical protein E2562_029731 [Oryza meyeriana var. granulata]|uniref:Uncharacterized protein n=1 Tax=Oryza meyeriana var. granulata TaxID=110450 RepID=A0A6G1ER21_9ORYZ|nr:hypothetical protein E2562_029731 [Oryza meyeriana var. granulata]
MASPATSDTSTAASPSNPPSVELCTPPTEASFGTDEGPRHYRTVVNTLATTTPILDFDYSEECLLAVEEPVSFTEAEKESCWRRAMIKEMNSIEGYV